MLWNKQISNNITTRVHACTIDDDIFLVVGSLGHLKVFSKTGDEVFKIKSEKRLSTDFLVANEHVVFGTKSEIVSLKICR